MTGRIGPDLFTIKSLGWLAGWPQAFRYQKLGLAGRPGPKLTIIKTLGWLAGWLNAIRYQKLRPASGRDPSFSLHHPSPTTLPPHPTAPPTVCQMGVQMLTKYNDISN